MKLNTKTNFVVTTQLRTHSTQQPTMQRIQTTGLVALHTWQRRADISINARARFEQASLLNAH